MSESEQQKLQIQIPKKESTIPQELTPKQQEALEIIQGIVLDDNFRYSLLLAKKRLLGVKFILGFANRAQYKLWNHHQKNECIDITWDDFKANIKSLKAQLVEVILNSFKDNKMGYDVNGTMPEITPLESLVMVVHDFIEELMLETNIEIDFKTDIIDKLKNYGVQTENILPKELYPEELDKIEGDEIYYALKLVEKYLKLQLPISNINFSQHTIDSIKERLLKNFVKVFTSKEKNTSLLKLHFEPIKAFKLIGDLSVELIDAKYHDNPSKIIPLLQNKELFKKSITEIKSIFGDEFLVEILEFVSQLKYISPEITNLTFLLQKIRESDSPEIQRLLSSITDSILTSENPNRIYEKIISIFAQNHLQSVAKYFLLFNELYPSKVLEGKITEHTSPILKEAGDKRRRFIIWTDLIKSQILSGNWELLNYLQKIENVEKLLEKLEQNQDLNSQEIEQIESLFVKLNTVHSQTILAKRREKAANSENKTPEKPILDNETNAKNYPEDLQAENLKAKWQTLKDSFGLQNGQKLTDRLIEMFAKPLGLNSLKEIQNLATNSKIRASQRNREVENLNPLIEQNSLIKAINFQDVELILSSGLAAREFIGGQKANSNSTPFDLDTLKIQMSSAIKECQDLPKISEYGNIILVIKNSGQFETQNNFKKVKYNPEKYELIHTPVVADNHYGIRTALASVEISKIILTEIFEKDKKEQKIQELFYKIARNGFYIPVFDKDGKLIFTSQEFDKFRNIFTGIERFGGDKIKIKKIENPKLRVKMQQILTEQNQSQETLITLQKLIQTKLRTIFAQFGILEQNDNNYLGFDLQDSGSTGRNTYLPPTSDFDYIFADFPILTSKKYKM